MLPSFVLWLFRVWLAVVLKIVCSDYVKQRILFYRHSGKSLQQIVQSLAEEGNIATKASVAKFLRYYDETGMITRTPGGTNC